MSQVISYVVSGVLTLFVTGAWIFTSKKKKEEKEEEDKEEGKKTILHDLNNSNQKKEEEKFVFLARESKLLLLVKQVQQQSEEEPYEFLFLCSLLNQLFQLYSFLTGFDKQLNIKDEQKSELKQLFHSAPFQANLLVKEIKTELRRLAHTGKPHLHSSKSFQAKLTHFLMLIDECYENIRRESIHRSRTFH